MILTVLLSVLETEFDREWACLCSCFLVANVR